MAFPSASIALCAVSLALTVGARADERSDSLEYAAKRQLILEQGADEREGAILSAAEDLARDGYYPEARDLLFSMQDTAQADFEGEFDRTLDSARAQMALGKGAGAKPATSSRASGYVQSGIDYDRWDGVDTILSAHVRGKLEWIPAGKTFERVAAVAQASDRNAYFDATAKGATAHRLLRFETEALAEKLLWRPYGDSLDRFYFLLRLDPTTRPLGKPVAAEAPIFLESEQYRHDRFGSPSHYAAGIAPGVQAMSENTAKSLLLSWDARGYVYPGEPDNSFFRDGPVASGWWYGDRLVFDAESRLATTRYNRDTSLTRDLRLETEAGGSVRIWRWIKAGLRLTGESEMDDYKDSVRNSFGTVSANYRLTGSAWTMRPQLSADWKSTYTATLGMAYTRSRYPVLSEADGLSLRNVLFLNTSNDDWKAEAGFTMLTKAIFLVLSLDYEENWVPYNSIYSLGSSKGIGLGGNLYWKLRPWFEIDATLETTRRLSLAPGFSGGMISDNLQLSAGFTSNFP
ncbi:MAG: hypothetical protein JF616_11355 [Fibrobacteres bacterium]|nr:hypothetical protein [Fibrobacterota bacterium]